MFVLAWEEEEGVVVVVGERSSSCSLLSASIFMVKEEYFFFLVVLPLTFAVVLPWCPSSLFLFFFYSFKNMKKWRNSGRALMAFRLLSSAHGVIQ